MNRFETSFMDSGFSVVVSEQLIRKRNKISIQFLMQVLIFNEYIFSESYKLLGVSQNIAQHSRARAA